MAFLRYISVFGGEMYPIQMGEFEQHVLWEQNKIELIWNYKTTFIKIN